MIDWRDELMDQIRAKVGDSRFESEYIGSLVSKMYDCVIYLDETDRAKSDALVNEPYMGETWVEGLHSFICGYLYE